MAWSHVQSSAIVKGNNTHAAINVVLSGVVAGNVLVAFCSAYNGALGSGALTDDKGNTWAQIIEEATHSDPFTVGMYYSVITTGGTVTVTFDSTAGRYPTFCVAEFAPTGTVSLDTGVKNEGSSPITVTGNTPAQADNLALVAYSWYSSDNPADASGWTAVGEMNDYSTTQTLWCGYKIQASASAPSATLTAGSVAMVGVIASLSATGGGGGGVTVKQLGLLGVG